MTRATASAATPIEGGVREHLLRLQRRQALAVMALPFAGALALALFRFHPTPLGVGLFASFFALSTWGITVGYHRLLAHGAFWCPPGVRATLAALGCLAAEGPPIFWVANHRLHHQRSEKEGDPHSPHAFGPGAINRLRSFWHAHMGWMLTEPPADPLRYAPDLLRDRVVGQVNRRYLLIVGAGLIVPALIGFLAWGGPLGLLDGLLWGGLARMFAVQQLSWSVNSVCHLFGARRYETGEQSRNHPVIGLLAFGEGWHNNHHAAPTSAAHGQRWWQIDLSFALIRLLQALRLARDVQIADPARLERLRLRR